MTVGLLVACAGPSVPAAAPAVPSVPVPPSAAAAIPTSPASLGSPPPTSAKAPAPSTKSPSPGTHRAAAGVRTATGRYGNAPAGIVCRTASGPVNLVCTIGRSVQGRAIVAERQGSGDSRRLLLVSGQMHGNEWPGPMVVDRLRRLVLPSTAGYQLWTVRTMNPDGAAASTRYDARGVDLNANFPAVWVRTSRSGSRALSEPEAVAMTRLLRWLQPDVVVSLHGFLTAVDTTGGGLRAARAQRFSALSCITPAHPVPCSGPCHGNLTDWYTSVSAVRGVAFTVEMPSGSLSARPCGVPGRPGPMSVVDCTAYAALTLAAEL